MGLKARQPQSKPAGVVESLIRLGSVIKAAADDARAGDDFDWKTFVNGDAWTIFLIIMTGPMTVIPLFLFNYGAIRVRLATLGLMQYAAPTVQFILAVILYGEVLTDTHLITFGLIWAGLALFSWDTWTKERELRRVTAGS